MSNGKRAEHRRCSRFRESPALRNRLVKRDRRSQGLLSVASSPESDRTTAEEVCCGEEVAIPLAGWRELASGFRNPVCFGDMLLPDAMTVSTPDRLMNRFGSIFGHIQMTFQADMICLQRNGSIGDLCEGRSAIGAVLAAGLRHQLIPRRQGACSGARDVSGQRAEIVTDAHSARIRTDFRAIQAWHVACSRRCNGFRFRTDAQRRTGACRA